MIATGNRLAIASVTMGILALGNLGAQLVNRPPTNTPQEQTIKIPNYIVSLKLPEAYTKRGDLQRKVVNSVAEEDLRSPLRLIESINHNNRGSKGPIGSGYKYCVLRLGSDPQLKRGTTKEVIESFSSRISISIGRRDLNTPPMNSIDKLYQSAPTNKGLIYSFLPTTKGIILEVKSSLEGHHQSRIVFDSEDDPKMTRYYYKVLDENTYLEIGVEGATNKDEFYKLAKEVIESIEVKGVKTGTSQGKLVLPIGRGSKNGPGEILTIIQGPEGFTGDYVLKSVEPFQKRKVGEGSPTIGYIYQKRSENLQKLEEKELAMWYVSTPHIRNLQGVSLYKLNEDGRKDIDSEVKTAYTIKFDDDVSRKRGILVENSIPTENYQPPIVGEYKRQISEPVPAPN